MYFSQEQVKPFLYNSKIETLFSCHAYIHYYRYIKRQP
ncbi:hypothetical protein EC2864350_1215 [Escherichia coli 2864350]|nr:hypothetical protein UMNK88_1469 [Escherichia coli UMNK88]EHX90876.1 hypothetical protein ECDEC14C_1369 [Escherichia coli DEC14C]EKH96067.1 hypothetical protein EC5905_1897 [Escherichia coli 5905]EKI13470.1 hypothetical protein ECEC96038_1637 [Escherichia coli EC96038]EKK72554.1 hypothetical protein EC100869_1614 [Escherichia coli 10.0869]EKW63369.1 hypothetical protein EC960932_1874 [Escherichia coli 96.0932]EMU63336.1 hypothetical protein ECMP0215527_1465 [Escherichia coli MP021552.7]EM